MDFSPVRVDCPIIGIVGPIACGKGVVVDYLKNEFGYTSFSLSSMLHDELKKRRVISFTRTVLQDVGDELRKSEGDDVLAKRAIKRLKAKNVRRTKIIIEGIRNPGEITYLRTIPGFFLISVNAPQDMRFRRVIARGKPWDPKDWNSFLKVDRRDREDKNNTNGQQVRACMKLADVHLKNDGKISEFCKNIKKTLSSRHPLYTGR